MNSAQLCIIVAQLELSVSSSLQQVGRYKQIVKAITVGFCSAAVLPLPQNIENVHRKEELKIRNVREMYLLASKLLCCFHLDSHFHKVLLHSVCTLISNIKIFQGFIHFSFLLVKVPFVPPL